MGEQIVMYVPVIHRGYEDFLSRHTGVHTINLLGAGFNELLPVLKKEIRALSADRAADYLRHRYHRPQVRVVEPSDLIAAVGRDRLIMPDEDIMHDLSELFGLDKSHDIDYVRTFLRWDREWSKLAAPTDPDVVMSTVDFDQQIMAGAISAAGHSSDWWRQVGSAIVMHGEIAVISYNHHLPTEYTPYLNGDPRNSFKRGVHVELSTAIHGEAAAIAYCARNGIATEQADIYVTAFPCPGCARLIAEAGISRCFFAGPYSMLEGEEVLRQANVQMIWVNMTSPPSS